MPEKSVISETPRILIFIVAYEAEAELRGVLERIPVDGSEYEVLLIDDASKDRTFEVGLRSAESHPLPVKVLASPENQGYGGNQKLGYEYAIQHGFDFVVLLHGDGQYAPEYTPSLLEPLVNGEADAVFGSRMMLQGAARAGGMPLYKFLGNKILTRVQNHLLGTRLSEFHSGFRAYRVSALEQIPFQYNSNVFHFDTEIIIQFVLGGFRIVEVPIPTYYGDEICRVNGVPYAWNVVLTTVQSRLHGLNIFYDRRFDVEGPANVHYSLKLGYQSSHSAALSAVPSGARVLDIGCGPGDFARQLSGKGCSVDGADQFAPVDSSVFREFRLWEDPAPVPFEPCDYDWVLLLDIVEHLKDPEQFLDQLRSKSRSHELTPKFLVTTGNIVFLVVRLQALFGNFNYGKRGILDRTHSRLYTFRSLRTLFRQCGFRVERLEGIPAPFPLALGENRFSKALVKLNSVLIRLSRGLFSYQILMVASPLPTVEALLARAVASSAVREAALREHLQSDGEGAQEGPTD